MDPAGELLSPAQLVALASSSAASQDASVSSSMASDGSPVEQKATTPLSRDVELIRLRPLLGDRQRRVSRARVQAQCQLSEAEWQPERGLARLTKRCGKHWEVMGHARDGHLYLYPEETLFLLECHQLSLYHRGPVPMSLQQAYRTLVDKARPADADGHLCSWPEYQAYAHLARLGYKMLRHQGQLAVVAQPTQSSAGRAGSRKRPAEGAARRQRERAKVAVVTVDLDDDDGQESDVNALRNCLSQPGPSWLGDVVEGEIERQRRREPETTSSSSVSPQKRRLSLVEVDPQVPVVDVEDACDHPTNQGAVNEDDVETLDLGDEESQPNEANDDDEIQMVDPSEVDRSKLLDAFPNCYRRTKMTLYSPPAELLPYRAWPKKDVYVLNINVTKDPDRIRAGRSKKSDDDEVEVIAEAPSHTVVGNRRCLDENKWMGYHTMYSNGGMSFNRGRDRWSQNSALSTREDRVLPVPMRIDDPAETQDIRKGGRGFYSQNSLNCRFFGSGKTSTRGNGSQFWPRGRGANRKNKRRLGRKPAKQFTNIVMNKIRRNPFAKAAASSTGKSAPKKGNTIDLTSEEVARDEQEKDDDDVMEVSCDLSDEEEEPDIIDESLTDGPLAALWKGKTKPLLRPSQAWCTEAIMERITLRHQPLAPAKKCFGGVPLKLSFDVYAPKMVFRKSAPRLPNYRVCVIADSDTALPSEEETGQLLRHLSPDGVPLLFAVSRPGSVSFYGVSKIKLPSDVIMG